MLQNIFYTFQWHLRCQSKFKLNLSPTFIHFNKFVSLNSMQNKVHLYKSYILILSSIQYIFIPASNIPCNNTISVFVLLWYCFRAWLSNYILPRCMNHYCVVIIQRHDENLCWSCPLPTTFSTLRFELSTKLPTILSYSLSCPWSAHGKIL